MGVSAAGRLLAAPDRGRRQRLVYCNIPAAPEVDPVVRRLWGGKLAAHGFVDGENLEFEIVRAKTLNLDPNPEWDGIARRVVDSRPDALLLHMAWAPFITPLTRDIPIVFLVLTELDFDQHVASARRPGGNVTGFFLPIFAMQAKLLEMLKELRPDARRAAVVGMRTRDFQVVTERMRTAAARLGMEGVAVEADDARIPGRLADKLRAQRVQIAHFFTGGEDHHPEAMRQIIELGIAPGCFSSELLREEGHLLAYGGAGGIDIVVDLLARVLRGEPVATMPAQQVREFHVTINMRTARQLRIAIPPSMLVRAHEIVD